MVNSTKPVIVVIDDQILILKRVIQALEHDYNVRLFSSGRFALKYFEKETADLILLDYYMPDMSGCEVLETLQKNTNTQNIPVIFLTGSLNDATQVEVLEKGAADYLIKPVHDKVLLARIHMHLELFAYRNKLEALVDEKTREIKQRESITLDLLARATDMRDHDTGGHIARTTEMVRIIVSCLQNNQTEGYAITKTEANDIIESAKLHDIGKIAIPDDILLKPGKLTNEEFAVIKKHPLDGASMLEEYIEQIKDNSFLRTARDIALYHHEKWDGSGYPFGLKQSDIPLSARITAIADVYDALVSERPYKKPFTHEKAVSIISDDKGKHFDPYLTDIFLEHESAFNALFRPK